MAALKRLAGVGRAACVWGSKKSCHAKLQWHEVGKHAPILYKQEIFKLHGQVSLSYRCCLGEQSFFRDKKG
ncbi:hypothetical protein C7N43_03840 [Sphingobacteriales bacterium UPWRP_1]|nr:hypothetical protein B6N25_05480 [Sphingobacteriales bacterium TSM_CSS]PSJ78343.1 hypothetical protein C7N43_03840 [Sphingobacteriales bacterium UPWRP_1]